jgi:hypothetical protein
MGNGLLIHTPTLPLFTLTLILPLLTMTLRYHFASSNDLKCKENNINYKVFKYCRALQLWYGPLIRSILENIKKSESQEPRISK